MKTNGREPVEAGAERVELKIAGIGGQGVLLAAQLLARAGLEKYSYVTWFPSYGTQKRGGESTCTVILSRRRIHSPILSHPKTIVMMHTAALDRFEDTVAPGGLIIADSSLVNRPVRRDDVASRYVPANKTAIALGSAQLANVVLAGTFVACTGVLPIDLVAVTLDTMLKDEGKERYLAVNREALRRGYELGKEAGD